MAWAPTAPRRRPNCGKCSAAQIVDNYRCAQHDGLDEENLRFLGHTALGHPVRVNARLLEADVRILTGFIEPHLFAGFSGGPKAVLPAVCGAESVLTNHGRELIAHPAGHLGHLRRQPDLGGDARSGADGPAHIPAQCGPERAQGDHGRLRR